MVVCMNFRKSIQKTLSFNEAKVRAGVGELILASGFGADIRELNFYQKLRRLQELNQNAMKIKTNTLRISVNFRPDEKLPRESIPRLALDYMDRIRFGDQPLNVDSKRRSIRLRWHYQIRPICNSPTLKKGMRI